MISGIIKKIRKTYYRTRSRITRLTSVGPKMKFRYTWFYKHCRIKKNQILFESFHGKDISDSPFYILKSLMETGEAADYKIYFATNDKKRDSNIVSALNLPVELVDVNTIRYAKVLATSKYIITNSSLPVYFIRRDGQEYLQTWHGTPLKVLGKQLKEQIGTSVYFAQHSFLQANYLMFPNEFTRDAMMRDYNLENLYTGKVLMNGYPRNSIFLNEDRALEVKKILQNEAYTTFAYMPTWRGKSSSAIDIKKYSRETFEILDTLDKVLNDRQKLYVNFHPLIQNAVSLGNYKHIFPFPQEIEKYDFLNSTDCLITDYSSVFFDYSITRKPIILFMYDYDGYMKDRGTYFDVRELPFVKLYDLESLSRCISTESFRENHYENTEYIKTYLPYDAPDAGKKMADAVLHHDFSGIQVQDYASNGQKPRNIFHPGGIKTIEDLNSVAACTDKDADVVVFHVSPFTVRLNTALYENYNDSFDYVFVTNTMARTYLEEFFRRFSERTNERLAERERRRILPGLTLGEERVTYQYLCPEGSFYTKPTLYAECKISVSDNALAVDARAVTGTAKKLILSTLNRQILWCRDTTEEEQRTGIIRETFDTFMALRTGRNNTVYALCLEIADEAGSSAVYRCSDQAALQEALSKLKEDDESGLNYKPLFFDTGVGFQGDFFDTPLALLPFLNKKDGAVRLQLRKLENAISRGVKGKIEHFSIKKNRVILTISFQYPLEESIHRVFLTCRSRVEDTTYDFDYTVEKRADAVLIRAELDVNVIDNNAIYWDIYVSCMIDGREMFFAPFVSESFYRRLLFFNVQAESGKGFILFPYRTKGYRLAFVWREKNRYDTALTKLKELTALAVYALLLPYWKKKRLWLVFEKYSAFAQDNGFYFFRFCMEELPPEENRHIYYVIEKNSNDWKNVEPYKDHVIPYMSFRHILYLLVAKIYIGSDARTHLYIWRPKPNLISQRMSHHRIHFLQHGVIGIKKIDSFFSRRGTNPMTFFTASSEMEQKIIVENFGYQTRNVPVLGQCRWDVLQDTSAGQKQKIILLMPTWRAWLEEKTKEEFVDSDYYRVYMDLLNSPLLHGILKKNNVKLVFFLHPKFREYMESFDTSEDCIELVTMNNQPMNEIIMAASMLITDYSSVSWDFFYQDKPVLFFQFDYQTFMEAHGSYMDMEHDLFGDRYTGSEELIAGIEEYINAGFKEKPQYKALHESYLPQTDHENSRRTYEFIVGKKY